MPDFAPLRVRGGGCRHWLRRAVRRRRRAVVVGLAVSAAALAVATPRPTERADAHTEAAQDAGPKHRRAVPRAEMVSAPVRIADAETVRLLRRGDRVDVIASANSPSGGRSSRAEVVAAGVRVTDVPKSGETSADGGALVVLSVPRATAAQLAGAGATSRLAVTLC
ncbi:RcpC/CpaB family pilus assembly protein [Streptomyces sp. NBC_00237]|uniref:RcpC/CpaB family pilus assembly protein n=1 Tax=Streptomyces sp. NBC_00237 TaxID=2975687 RepID=UPI002B1E6181|nr:RcpC/CpaB family pilus assembly protein [Streptomyces sp. NBC_00237]